jgi:hypothetical protein
MTYASGGTIQATDYNNLAWGGTQGTYTSSPNNIAYVMGVGNGQFGYGQDVSLINTVSASNDVTAAQWAGLVFTLNRALAHQSGVGAQLASGGNINMTAGETITYFANVATAVGTINTNATVASTTGATTTGATFSQSNSAANGTAAQTFTFTRTITFASGNAARYFFNAGGRITFTHISAVNNDGTSRTGGLTTIMGWISNITNIRGLTNGGRSGSGGTADTANVSVGYWNAGTIGSTMVKISQSAGTYSGDYIEVKLRTNGVQGANGDVGNILYLDFTVFSAAEPAYAAPPANPPGSGTTTTNTTTEDSINYTWNHRIDITVPSTTYLTSTWGTPTVS